VGAGPSGLLLALFLAQKGISVEVLEATNSLDEQPRASHYGSPAIAEMRRAGIMEDVHAKGLVLRETCWRKIDGTYLAGLDNAVLGDYPDKVTSLPLNELSEIIYEHLMRFPHADVKWLHKVTGLGQNENVAWVDVETPEGTKKMEADYIVGCDGANSQVRRSLFGPEYPGKTWNEQIVATNVFYDFHKFGYVDANFIIDKEHWYMAAKITCEGLWRVSYGEKGGLTREQQIERQPWKFETMLPGHPKPGDYKLANISPYKMHQRLAEKLRVGRFLLAADAAHLCNPFGGLGLTGGIVDVGGLADCLIGIHEGKADEKILDKYNDVRREKYQTIVNPISSDNLRRMFQDPETALEKDPWMQTCLKAAKDDNFSKELQLSVNSLRYDFTQDYFKTNGTTNGTTDVGKPTGAVVP